MYAYKGLMKIYTNQKNICEGSTAVEEQNDKDQAWRLPNRSYFAGTKLTRPISKVSPYLFIMMTGSRLQEGDSQTRVVVSDETADVVDVVYVNTVT
jgi:hypothetical protein